MIASKEKTNSDIAKDVSTSGDLQLGKSHEHALIVDLHFGINLEDTIML